MTTFREKLEQWILDNAWRDVDAWGTVDEACRLHEEQIQDYVDAASVEASERRRAHGEICDLKKRIAELEVEATKYRGTCSVEDRAPNIHGDRFHCGMALPCPIHSQK